MLADVESEDIADVQGGVRAVVRTADDTVALRRHSSGADC